jgi:Fe2+ transport system protein FeoA
MKTDITIVEGEAGTESLACLPENALARIESLDNSAGDVQRLEVMGLCEGRLVQVVKRGDPMIVRVLGTRVGLAAGLAERVRVRFTDPPPLPAPFAGAVAVPED